MPGFRNVVLIGKCLPRAFAICVGLAALAPVETENAVANGDTRTISLVHAHTHETITATFRVDGVYDPATLEKLNWFLRDWRRDEPTHMDPRLFDAIWLTYRESGSHEPIMIMSAYRSPETNAMLRRRSRAVAEFSQHMLGKAMDMHYQDVPMSRVREIAMRLQRGGVGYYPTAGTPFVHMDVGNVRAWPRMSYDQLARLFPDGKTVHVPSNGVPLARYEEARAEIEARNGVSVPTIAQVKSKGFFATLFGGGGDDEEGAEVAEARGAPRVGGDSRVAGFIERARTTNAATRLGLRGGVQVASAPASVPAAGDTASIGSIFAADLNRRSPAVERAERDLPKGETYLSPPPVVMSAPPEPTRTALLEPRPNLTPVAAAPAPAPAVASTPTPASEAAAPLPPRRPIELASFGLSDVAPLPPARPAELAPPPARVAELPTVITTGGKPAVAASLASAGVLAFAPATPPLPTPRPSIALSRAIAPIGLRAAALQTRAPRQEASPPRVDRGNFRLLTAPVELAHLDGAAIAPVPTGLRRAGRAADISSLVFDERFAPAKMLPPARPASEPRAGQRNGRQAELKPSRFD